MTWTMWAALIVVVGTVWALIKRYDLDYVGGLDRGSRHGLGADQAL